MIAHEIKGATIHGSAQNHHRFDVDDAGAVRPLNVTVWGIVLSAFLSVHVDPIAPVCHYSYHAM